MFKKFFTYISVFYILWVTFPLMGQVLHIPIQVACIIVSAVVILTCPKALMNKASIWLALYMAILCIYAFSDKEVTLCIGNKNNIVKILMEMAFILPAFSTISVCNYYNDNKIIKILFYTSVIGLGVSFLYLIPITVINANILRMSMKADELGIDPVMGAPRYALMHAYVFFAPPALYACLVNKGKMKVFFIVFFAMLVYMILRCYITTTIIILLGVLAAFYLRGSGSKAQLIKRSFVMFIVLIALVASGGVNVLYESTSGFFEGSYAESKFLQLGDALRGNASEGNSLSERQDIHSLPIKSFIENPITGCPQVSGHSNILDRLGGLGLVGFIPYIMLLITIWKQNAKRLRHSSQSRFVLNTGCVIVFILLYEKGIFNYEGWAFYAVILPIAALYLSTRELGVDK